MIFKQGSKFPPKSKLKIQLNLQAQFYLNNVDLVTLDHKKNHL